MIGSKLKIILFFIVLSLFMTGSIYAGDIAAWLERHPIKFIRYNIFDRSYGYMWVYRYSYDWTNKYFYRPEWEPRYHVSPYTFKLYWRVSQRWGMAYPTQLAEATFNIDWTPRQKYYNLWWGDQHKYRYHNIYLETWWKIAGRLAFGVYLQSYNQGWTYNKDYVNSFKRIKQYGTGAVDDVYRGPTESEWNNYNVYGYYALYDYDQKYYRIGFGLKWYGYDYLNAYYGNYNTRLDRANNRLDPKPRYPK